MTVQIPDKFRYDSKVYHFVAQDTPSIFDPKNYGFEPQVITTACWRGHICEYEIADFLILEKFHIFNAEGKYPDFNGTPALRGPYGGLYRTNMKIDFTGNILLGSGFIKEYVTGGYQRPWAYTDLKEFIFERGFLKKVIDRSDSAQRMREEIETNPKNTQFGSFLYHG